MILDSMIFKEDFHVRVAAELIGITKGNDFQKQKDYVSHMRGDVYGSNIELAKACKLFNRNIIVHQINVDEQYKIYSQIYKG